MTEKNKFTMPEQEQPFLPGVKYNPENDDFYVWDTSVRQEPTEEEIDRMDCAPEIKTYLINKKYKNIKFFQSAVISR